MTLIPLIILLIAVFLVKPKIVPGSGGFNSLIGYQVPPDEETLRAGQSPAGRLAQERGEFRWAWVFGCLIATPFALLLDEPFAWGAVVIAFLANAVGRILTHHWDAVGTNIEIAVAEDDGWVGYREAEINRLRDWSGDYAAKNKKLRRWEWLASIVRVIS